MSQTNITLTQKDLSLLSDLMTYEQWAAKKSKLCASMVKDADIQNICKTLEENHTKNFNELYNFLNAF